MGKIYYKKLSAFIRLNILIICFLAHGLHSQTFGQTAPEATLKFTVRDNAGQPIAFRVQVFDEGKQIGQLWERGKAGLTLPAGKHTILISHGFDYDAVLIDTLYLPAGVTEKTVTLRKRFDLCSLGWYCGESHMHGQHGSTDTPQTFKDAARLAEANGLNYVQIAQWWTPDFAWTSQDTLIRMAMDATTPLVVVNWNMESPKCYMGIDDGGKSGNLLCYGHGCTLGLKERSYDKSFWFSGPNFHIIHEIHRQNAVVTLAHPVRFWFNNGNFVSNMASEIAFDYIIGEGYDGVDIFNDGEPLFFQHERVWWNLLNMGFKVSGTANTDGSIINGEAGRYRTYTRIQGDFSWEKIAQGIRDGACIASSGPMVLFDVDGKDPGSEFPADGRTHRGSLKIWSGPLPGETLVSVQVIRNGEIVRAWDLRSKKAREWSGVFHISDTSFAWYVIRVTSTCKNPGSLAAWKQPVDLYEVAVANPVYFIPAWFHRPTPTLATVKLHITDEDSYPLKAKISVVDYGKEIYHLITDAKGTLIFNAPATASFVINAPGFIEVKKDLYMDSPVYSFCQNFNDYYTPGSYNNLRELLGNLSFEVKLKRKATP
jgi:hypothetical protein